MPSENTWASVAGFKQANYSGRVRSWVTTPNFGALAKDSKPVNPYSDTKYISSQSWYAKFFSMPGYTAYEVSPQYRYDGNALVASLGAINTADWAAKKADADNTCVTKTLVKMADAKVNVAVAFAEAAKTSDLIYDTARRIDRAYRAFRKGDLRGIARNLNITPKKLHNSWLEYKYGWMPLLMDVKGAAEFFAQQHVVRPPRFRVTSKVKAAKAETLSGYTETYGGSYGDWTQTTTEQSASYEVRTTYWCELSYPHLAELQQIGLTNPLLVAWELVPYSFVFDWFIQVGDYLTAITAQNGVTIRRSLKSSLEEKSYEYNRPGTVRTSGSLSWTEFSQRTQAASRTYSRASNVPSPTSLYPTRVNSFGFAKLVTSLALLKGSYRGNARI